MGAVQDATYNITVQLGKKSGRRQVAAPYRHLIKFDGLFANLPI